MIRSTWFCNLSLCSKHDSSSNSYRRHYQQKSILQTDGFTFTLHQLKQAFDIYNADMLKVDKEYTHSNIPELMF
ncbi:MAG: glycoside hydrolase family 70 protein [Streptococcus sp.]